jgi:hypothetical protein
MQPQFFYLFIFIRKKEGWSVEKEGEEGRERKTETEKQREGKGEVSQLILSGFLAASLSRV